MLENMKYLNLLEDLLLIRQTQMEIVQVENDLTLQSYLNIYR